MASIIEIARIRSSRSLNNSWAFQCMVLLLLEELQEDEA